MFKNVDWFNIVAAAVGLFVAALLGVLLVWLVTSLFNPDNCTLDSYSCRAHQVELCQKAGNYNREECIQLLGSGK